MRVLLINWAPISRGARLGGGVNGYCQRLALGLVRKGVDVTYCSSGVAVTPKSVFPGPAVVERPAWNGVRVLEVVNSPVIAPGVLVHHSPGLESSCPELEAVMTSLVAGEAADGTRPRFDVVHFHNIEGWSAGCVSAASKAGARVVFSLHNYHPLCPQVYFLHRNSSVCEDFEGGVRCASCVPADYAERTQNDRSDEWAASVGRAEFAELFPQRVRVESERLSAMVGSDSLANGFGNGGDGGGGFAFTTVKPTSVDVPAQAVQLRVLNDPMSDRSGPAVNAFGRRRAAMVAALNACDAVHAVSTFVAAKYVAMGVRATDDEGAKRVHTIHIGTEVPASTGASGNARATLCPDGRIRLVFLGYHNHAKGLHVLLSALEHLDEAAAARFELSIAAKDIAPALARISRLAGRLHTVRVADGYKPTDLPAILAEHDVGVVPSVWWDNGPQTVLEFQAHGLPVVASRLGGIPDQVRDGTNGLLFTGGDHQELAALLADLNIEKVRALAVAVVPPKSIATHTAEILGLYTKVLQATNSAGRPTHSHLLRPAAV